MRAYKTHLRYKHMVARLEGLPFYKKEAALLQEIAKGRRWRIDAAIEAIKPAEFQYMNTLDIFKNIGRFGRLTALDSLSKAMRINGKADEYSTPNQFIAAFDAAAINGHYRVADYCAREGAKPDLMMSQYEYPRAMSIAIEERDFAKIDYLLNKGANVQYHFAKALHKHDIELVAYFIARGADVNKPTGDSGWTPIAIAASGMYDEKGVNLFMELVTNYGADLQAHGATALGHAIQNKRLQPAILLVAAGNRPTERDLFDAVYGGSYEVADILMTQGLNITEGTFSAAARSKTPQDGMAFCLKHGGDAQAVYDAMIKRGKPGGYDGGAYQITLDALKSALDTQNTAPPAPRRPAPPKP